MACRRSSESRCLCLSVPCMHNGLLVVYDAHLPPHTLLHTLGHNLPHTLCHTLPLRLRPSDLKFMYEVGLRVPIVPVVTKADTMTIREAGMYRSEVANKIANPMLPGGWNECGHYDHRMGHARVIPG